MEDERRFHRRWPIRDSDRDLSPAECGYRDLQAGFWSSLISLRDICLHPANACLLASDGEPEQERAGRVWWGTGRWVDSDARYTSCDLVRYPWPPEKSAARRSPTLHSGHAAFRPRSHAFAPQPFVKSFDRLWNLFARLSCWNGRRYRPVRTDQRISLQTSHLWLVAAFGTLPFDLEGSLRG